MAVKLIKKHQWGGSAQATSDINWNNLNSVLGDTYKNISQQKSTKFKMYPSTFNPDINTLKQSTPSGQISGINIKPIGQALTEDATRIKKLTDATGAANKAANTAKLTSGMNVASTLTDPILNVGEGIASSLGANFAEKDAQSGATDLLATGLGMLGPWGQAAGIGLKLFDTLDRGLGKGVKSFAGNTGSSSYSDFSTQGKQYRMTQGKKAGRAEAEKKVQQGFYGNAMQVKKQQDQLKTAAVDLGQQNQFSNINKLNSIDPSKSLLAKKGTKLSLKNIKAKANYNHSKKHTPLDQNTGEIINNNVNSFADGGKFNIIPEGALHAHKHSIDDPNDEMTTKGIPVVTVEEGGKLEQHAEIERNELIFHLDVSKQLEELHKRYKDEGDETAALEAGKLLVSEILENTIDNTNLINTIE